MTSQIDLSGCRYGRLTAKFYVGSKKWSCTCDCGSTVEVESYNLRAGFSKSCGCLKAELSSKRAFKHGHAKVGSNTPEYRAWAAARERCTNSKKKNWHRYGGRGIVMCDRWLNSFEAFLADVGLRPSPKHSIDRYPNNDGNYEPGNVRWATRGEQGRNTGQTRTIVIRGESMCLTDAAARFGKHRSFIRRRLDRGLSPEQAVGLE